MLCPEGVQNKCPGGGVWCRGFMSWGDTWICVISRGVQLFYGIAQYQLYAYKGKRAFVLNSRNETIGYKRYQTCNGTGSRRGHLTSY